MNITQLNFQKLIAETLSELPLNDKACYKILIYMMYVYQLVVFLTRMKNDGQVRGVERQRVN